MNTKSKEIATAINNGDRVDRIVDLGASFGRNLCEELWALGWKPSSTYSAMSKAPFEAAVAKGGRRVVITSSLFQGPFTSIEVFNE